MSLSRLFIHIDIDLNMLFEVPSAIMSEAQDGGRSLFFQRNRLVKLQGHELAMDRCIKWRSPVILSLSPKMIVVQALQ